MIFKEEDLVDLAEGKNAIQSTISRWSMINDAKRAISKNINIECYAFHTDIEDSPWWMVDLEEVCDIDYIRVKNRINSTFHFIKKALTMQVALSLDGVNWTLVSKELCKWDDAKLIFEAEILQRQKARYVKLFLKERNYFHLAKVEVFLRKVKGYIVAAKPDGFGMRLASMINAIYLSEKIDGKFAFAWPLDTDTDTLGAQVSEKSDDKNYMSVSIDKPENIFTKEFLEHHLIVDSRIRGYHGDFYDKDLKAITTIELARLWGWYINQTWPYKYLQNCEKSTCLLELKQSYNKICFSEKFELIKEASKKIFSSLNANFIALHMRGGEVVLGNFKKAPEIWMWNRHFPYELAIEIGLREIGNGNNIVIFGQDINANKLLKDYLLKYSNGTTINIVDDFIDSVYNDMERAFFEMNFMSNASKIYSTGSSIFSQCAEMIAGKELLISYHDFFTIQEMFEYIEKNIDCLNLHDLQKAYSCYKLYALSKKLGYSLEESIKYVYLALNYDPKNSAYKIAILDCMFNMRSLTEIDKQLRLYLEEDLEDFFDCLYGPHTAFPWGVQYYEDLRSKYIINVSVDYPNISYVAAKISLFQKNPSNALKFIQYSLKSQPDNKEFLSCKKEIEALLTKQEEGIAQSNKSQSNLQQPEAKANDKESQIAKISPDSFEKQLDSKTQELTLKNQQLNSKTKELNFTLRYGTAKDRIHNHLSYKLGQAMIENSKSLLGYIRMPYVLSYIKDKHEQEQQQYQETIKKNPNLKLPNLESYPDYKESLKEKECLTYKLGEAFIKASKTWYKGGYVRLWFEVRKLKKR